ncbi:MAG: DNA methyltransferase [Rhodomicrobium sp.]
MADGIFVDRDTEWLQLAPPVGLVVSAHALKELGLVAARQTPVDSAAVREHVAEDIDDPALADPWKFFQAVLGWRAQDVAGAPVGPPIPEHLIVHLKDVNTTLEPSWAVRAAIAPGDGPTHQLLVRIEERGVEPDAKKALDGWEATPQQRFERLLRETKVHTGLLITDEEIRLVYAPQGETSGWQSFPIRALASLPGRPILGGLKLLLDRTRLFGEPTQRFPTLLQRSREAQASVSTELSAQVLGALHELLRGLLAAERRSKGGLIIGLAKSHPHHLYEGLLTVLMRLVFVLYAEDRDLIPSKTDKDARWLYDQGYSVRGLFARLSEDEALNPDTMDERVGGWGQLLALFRLIHKGHGSGFIRARGGKLFDPDVFLFLEGRAKKDDQPTVMAVSDGCLLRILRGLMVLRGERLSYRALDVEAIGSVYETVMGFTVETTTGTNVAIKAGKNNKVPVFVDLDALLPLKPADRIKRIKEDTSRALSGRTETQVKAAKSVSELLAALDSIVDERGSPERRSIPAGTPVLQPTDERRRTGSHYTPRSLTLPIVLHALEPTLERLGPEATPAQILDLKVCDPAMGSGAFLVEACRQLGARLQQAWTRWPDQKPKVLPEDEDEELHAKRLVAQRCLYGVDKNPMAVDLAKLSLWLATLARDHEFEFVDHALKCGDSLVGLSVEGIAAANWDASKPGLPLFQKLVRDEIRRAINARAEIRDAPDDVHRAIQEVRHANAEKRLDPIRAMGDATIAAFFSEAKPRAREVARQKVESLFTASLHPNWDEIGRIASTLRQGEHPIRSFHWQLEFPEVFEGKNPGFDAIIGNPPFAGKNTIAAGNQPFYPVWLQALHPGSHGNADLAAHFYLRAFRLLRRGGCYGLIATQTIFQGDTRETGLAQILRSGGSITRGISRFKWQGEAQVTVAIVHVANGPCERPVLNKKRVGRISAYLVEGKLDTSPQRLFANAGRAFQGSIILGMGFTFDDEAAAKGSASSLADMEQLKAKGELYSKRILPFIGGEEVNNDPRHSYRRFIINLNDLNEEQARVNFPELLSIVEQFVKPERNKIKDAIGKEAWWRFLRPRPELHRAIAGLQRVLVTTLHSPQFSFAILPSHQVFSHALLVTAFSRLAPFAVMQSRIHEAWTRFFGSTLEDRLRYTPSDCFATFPFPPGFETDATLEAAGQAYHDHRAALMVRHNEGLTKTYNRFHNPAEDHPDIVKLRELHDAMDRAVLTAYGWTDLAARIATDPDAMPRHLSEDTEDDHKYQGRYFWPAPIRDEVLARLLALNATRAEEERKAGLVVTSGGDDDGDEDGNVAEDN